MKYTVYNKNIAIIRPNFTIGTSKQAQPLIESIGSAIEEKSPKFIIINLQHLTFIDSNFLGALVKSLKVALKKNAELVVTNLQPPVKSMFELTKLYNIFKVYSSEEDAISTLS